MCNFYTTNECRNTYTNKNTAVNVHVSTNLSKVLLQTKSKLHIKKLTNVF